MPPTNKRKFMNNYRPQKWPPASHVGSPNATDGQDCTWPNPCSLTCTQVRENDNSVPESATGVAKGTRCTDTTAGTANTPTSGVHISQKGGVSFPPIIGSSTPTSSTLGSALMTEHTTDRYQTACTPREGNRFRKGPSIGQDNPPRWLGRWIDELGTGETPQSGKRPEEAWDTSTQWLGCQSDEQTNIGVASSVTETETGWRAGGGAIHEDLRLNNRSQIGPQPSTRGDVTILTPFSTSLMTDMSVDTLPLLFLAYCALNHSDQSCAD